MLRKFFYFALYFTFFQSCFATPPFIVGQFGLGSTYTGGSSSMAITTDETDRLQLPTQSYFPQFSLGVGYQFPMQLGWQHNCFRFLNGFSLFANIRYMQTDLNGDVYQFQDPALNNYQYDISLESTRLMLDGTINLFSYGNCWQFYFLGGIGEALTRTNYDDAPLSNFGGAISLDSRINSGFVYELGLGLYVPFNNQARISLEYLYAHFPSLKLSHSGKINGVPDNILRAPQLPFSTQTLSLGLVYQL